MIFDALEYFKTLGKKNRLCKQHGFKPVFCSGPDSIEGVMQEFQKTANFVMIDDTTDGNTFSEGVSFFQRRVYTVFILASYKWDDMKDRKIKLNLCREIFKQFKHLTSLLSPVNIVSCKDQFIFFVHTDEFQHLPELIITSMNITNYVG